MRLVLIESPFAGRSPGCTDGTECRKTDASYNLAYAKALCLFVAKRGDAPYASHLLCTQFLDDTVPAERSMGIEIGLAWGAHAAVTVVGVDRGISTGMRYGIERARAEGRPIEWVSLAAYRDEWLPSGVDCYTWVELFRGCDRQVRDDI
jgi:hypothetical protein